VVVVVLSVKMMMLVLPQPIQRVIARSVSIKVCVHLLVAGAEIINVNVVELVRLQPQPQPQHVIVGLYGIFSVIVAELVIVIVVVLSVKMMMLVLPQPIQRVIARSVSIKVCVKILVAGAEIINVNVVELVRHQQLLQVHHQQQQLLQVHHQQ